MVMMMMMMKAQSLIVKLTVTAISAKLIYSNYCRNASFKYQILRPAVN